MKKEDFIKLGMDEELAKKCESQSLEELKGYVPYERFKELIDEKNQLKSTIKDRDEQLETLKTSAGDVQEMRKQIESLQSENKAKEEKHAEALKGIKIDSAIELAITGAKGKNAKAIKSLLDMSKIDLDKEGNVVGHTEQIEALMKAEDSSFLFGSQKTQIRGVTLGEGKDEGVKNTSKMSYSQLSAYMNENPDFVF